MGKKIDWTRAIPKLLKTRRRLIVKNDKLAELAALSIFLIQTDEAQPEMSDILTAHVKPEYARLWPRLSGGALRSALCRAAEYAYLRVGIENGQPAFGSSRGTNAVVEHVVNAKIDWE